MTDKADSNSLTCRIEGMDCPDCAAKIERVVNDLPGVTDARVSFAQQTLSARVASSKTAVRLRASVRSLGYRFPDDDKRNSPRHDIRLITAVVSGICVVLGLGLHFLLGSGLWEKIAYVVAILSSGGFMARKGFAALRHGALDMNFLMTVAVIGALSIDAWDEAAMVVFLFALAQLLETRAMDRARDAVRALMALAPPSVHLLQDEEEITVPVEAVSVGAVFRLYPGDRVPLDGNVVEGHSALNQAPITGEAMPVNKSPGDPVYAGSINMQGSLDVRVTQRAGDTLLAHISRLIEEAQASRAPAQAFIDRFARWYTPCVLVLALLIASLPPLLFGADFADWFYRALVLLVIACPCALVISTPVAIVSGLARGARAGVLIKGGIHLENIGCLRALAFDKTGTLTEGRPRVQEVETLGDIAGRELLQIAATLEARSEHPLAQAIITYAHRDGIQPGSVSGFKTLIGRGVHGRLDGHEYLLGNHRLFEERGLCTPEFDAILERYEAEAKTVVIVGDTQGILGLISIADQPREAARGVIGQLRALDIAHITLLTGDNRGTARAIAAHLGIDEVQAELLPADKVEAVDRLVDRYDRVGMVGDGVNDAPAMASATVGIAMGAAGSDTALETADLVLMSDDLTRLPFAIRLSRMTLRIIRENITLALSLKAIFLMLAIPGYATLWMAVFADMGASLLVIANSLRLLRFAYSPEVMR
jgi:Cd2+/Zn2+-exporting ATPase